MAWLAQRMDKTSVGPLLRCSWEAVDAIVDQVVVDHIDDARLDHLYRLGVDEISYNRGHKFLTIVADHDTGTLVWAGKQRSKAAFEEFFTALGPQRCLRQPGRRIEKHFDAIVAAVEFGLSNSRLEGINPKIRLIQRRGYGFRNLLEEMPGGDRDGRPVGRHGAHGSRVGPPMRIDDAVW